MLPKTFFENHFTGEVNNNLFTAVASDGNDDNKIEVIKRVKDDGKYFDEVVYIQEDPSTQDITYKIFDAIAKSKTLLFDLSNDARLCTRLFKKADKVNANVMYELGVALTIRNPNSIILIRKESDGQLKKVPFDIEGIKIHSYKNLNEEFVKRILSAQKEKKGYFKEQFINGVAKLIDEIGYGIIHWALKQPKDKRHFAFYIAGYIRTKFSDFVVKDDEGNKTKMHKEASDEEIRMSIFRLLDLGVLVKEAEYTNDRGFGHAYHWTEFGKEILEYIKKRPNAEKYLDTI